MVMAPNGHRLGQIPQPIHNDSEMKAIRDSGVTSICSQGQKLRDRQNASRSLLTQSFPDRTTGHDFLHSCRHFYFQSVSLAQNYPNRVVWAHLGFALFAFVMSLAL